jgi:hypothetical protein
MSGCSPSERSRTNTRDRVEPRVAGLATGPEIGLAQGPTFAARFTLQGMAIKGPPAFLGRISEREYLDRLLENV